MNNYEIMFLLSGKIDETNAKKIVENLVQSIQTKETVIDYLGLKPLAYPIKKEKTGQYFLATFKTEGANIAEIIRLILINKDILRHLVINKDKDYGARLLKNPKKQALAKHRLEKYQQIINEPEGQQPRPFRKSPKIDKTHRKPEEYHRIAAYYLNKKTTTAETKPTLVKTTSKIEKTIDISKIEKQIIASKKEMFGETKPSIASKVINVPVKKSEHQPIDNISKPIIEKAEKVSPTLAEIKKPLHKEQHEVVASKPSVKLTKPTAIPPITSNVEQTIKKVDKTLPNLSDNKQSVVPQKAHEEVIPKPSVKPVTPSTIQSIKTDVIKQETKKVSFTLTKNKEVLSAKKKQKITTVKPSVKPAEVMEPKPINLSTTKQVKPKKAIVKKVKKEPAKVSNVVATHIATDASFNNSIFSNVKSDHVKLKKLKINRFLTTKKDKELKSMPKTTKIATKSTPKVKASTKEAKKDNVKSVSATKTKKSSKTTKAKDKQTIAKPIKIQSIKVKKDNKSTKSKTTVKKIKVNALKVSKTKKTKK